MFKDIHDRAIALHLLLLCQSCLCFYLPFTFYLTSAYIHLPFYANNFINWTGVIFNKDTKCLPDKAIDYIQKVSKKSDRTAHYCLKRTSNSASSKKSSTNNLDTLKEVTNTIEDIIKLF